MPRIRSSNDYYEYVDSFVPILNNIVNIIRTTETHTYNLINRSGSSFFSSSTPTTSPFRNPIIQRSPNILTANTNTNTNPFENFIGNLTPITVSPTTSQIHRACNVIPYREIENPINDSCPITHEVFRPDEFVFQIRHCRHIFKERSIRRWFEGSVRCPVCRYDIRDYGNNTPIENPPQPESLNEPEPLLQPEPIQPEFSIQTTLIQETTEDLSNNINIQNIDVSSVEINTTISGNIQDDTNYNRLITELSTIIADNIISRNLENSTGNFNVQYNIQND
tara:strand:+ start:469 stop:1305 length:837 start_codon:yes stop_codon:yes gene_type:complete